MKFLNRFITTREWDLSPAQPDQPAQPASAPSALTLVAPTLRAPAAPAPRLPEFSPAIMAALAEGFALFPVTVGTIRARAVTAWLPAVTSDAEELQDLVSRHPGCQLGMLMGGGRFFAVRMEGEFGFSQFKAMTQFALFTTDDDADWGTRMIFGGNTLWAIYRSPDLEMRARRPDLGLGLSINDWTPAPGSEFSGAVYGWVNPAAKIGLRPRYLAQIVFEDPEAFEQSPKLLEFPSRVPR